MLELVAHLSAFGVFLAIAGVGFVFLLLSVVFGGLFEQVEAALDHDGDHGGDAGAPGFFSTRVMGVFITTFGGTGAIGTYYGLPVLPASLAGLASGFGVASLVVAFARFLYRQQASTEVHMADLVGLSGRVTVSIPKDGVGQVRCRVGEELVDKIARSSDGEPVGENAAITIEDVLGETVIVRRLESR